MPITTGLAIFFLIWWLVLFAVLPFGVRSQQEHGNVIPGSDPAAAAQAHLDDAGFDCGICRLLSDLCQAPGDDRRAHGAIRD